MSAPQPTILIKEDNLSNPTVLALLAEHFTETQTSTLNDGGVPRVLDVAKLRNPSVTMYTAWSPEGQLLGCGALKQLTPPHGELKSMRTVTAHLRKGVASALVRHILRAAQSRGLERVSLETGSNERYAAARAIYSRCGFVVCGPFGGYVEAIETSTFMTCEITPMALRVDGNELTFA